MEDRLVPVNAFIGLTMGTSALTDAALATAGFRLAALELPLSANFGPSPGKFIADAVAWHSESGTFLLAEVKSGRNVKGDQCHRYHNVRAQDIVRAAAVDVPRQLSLSVVVVYVAGAEHVNDVLAQLGRLGYSPPVFCVDTVSDRPATKIRLEGESATAQRLRAALHDEVRWQFPPSPHLPVDQDSDVKHYVPLVRQALVAAQALRQEFLSARDLASSIVPTLVFLSDGPKKRVVDKVVLAARQIAADKPGQYKIHGAGGANSEPRVEVLATPETTDPRGRTQQYQALARTSSSRRRRVPDPNQLDLLTELGVPMDSGDADREDDGTDAEGGSTGGS